MGMAFFMNVDIHMLWCRGGALLVPILLLIMSEPCFIAVHR